MIDIEQRITAAIERITSGNAPMRVPADETDPDLVLADCLAEIRRLRAELQNAAKAALDAVALSCEKEREADALRVDAERYRWLRNADNYPNPIGGFWNCLGETSEPEEMDEYIDAAMGASA